jgi:hypothetical protein
MAEMDELQRNNVNDHIGELLREGDSLRAERLARESRLPDTGPAVAGGRAGDHPPARVRLGHWLIGVGTAVAGTTRDHHGGATGHAA